MTLIFLLVSFFSATLAECLSCGWPYATGVNSSGKCYPLYSGYQQSDIASVCQSSCTLWANASDTTQYSASPVWDWANATAGSPPFCNCFRLRKGGYYERRSLSQNNCDYGVSDANQAYLDSLSSTHLSNKTQSTIASLTLTHTSLDSAASDVVKSAYNQTLEDLKHAPVSSFSMNGICGNNINACGDCNPYNGSGYSTKHGYGFFYYDDYSGYNERFHPIPDSITCLQADALNAGIADQSAALAKTLSGLNTLDTGIRTLNESVKGVSQSVVDAKSTIMNRLNTMDSTLNYKLNSGVGGGSIDVSGIYSAITASTSETGQHLDSAYSRLQSSASARQITILDSLSISSARIMNRLNSLDSLDSSIVGLRDTMSGVKGTIKILNDSVSSGNAQSAAAWASWANLFNQQVNGQNNKLDSIFNGAANNTHFLADTLAHWDSAMSYKMTRIGDILAYDTSRHDSAVSDTFYADTTNRGLRDSLLSMQHRYDNELDSLLNAIGNDSLYALMHHPFDALDTAGFDQAGKDSVSAARAVNSADSAIMQNSINSLLSSVCSEFPSDPVIALNDALFHNLEITIPITSKYSKAMQFFKTIIALEAAFVAMMIMIGFMWWSIRINIWFTGGRK